MLDGFVRFESAHHTHYTVYSAVFILPSPFMSWTSLPSSDDPNATAEPLVGNNIRREECFAEDAGASLDNEESQAEHLRDLGRGIYNILS